MELILESVTQNHQKMKTLLTVALTLTVTKMTLWTQPAQTSHSGQYTSLTVPVVHRFTDSPSKSC